MAQIGQQLALNMTDLNGSWKSVTGDAASMGFFGRENKFDLSSAYVCAC
jgi:hypothetical protein